MTIQKIAILTFFSCFIISCNLRDYKQRLTIEQINIDLATGNRDTIIIALNKPDTFSLDSISLIKKYLLLEFPSNRTWECIDTLNENIEYKTCCHVSADKIALDKACFFYHTYRIDKMGRVIKYDGAGSGFFSHITITYDNENLLKQITDNGKLISIKYNKEQRPSIIMVKAFTEQDTLTRSILIFNYE